MKMIFALIGICILTGCSSVVMNSPFPETRLTEDEQTRLKGAWQINEQVLFFEFTTNGTPTLAMIDWKDEGFKLQSLKVQFARFGRRLYFSLPTDEPEKDHPPTYAFGELKIDKEGVMIWLPEVEFFAKQVEGGKLKGTAERDKHSTTVQLETAPEDILNLIATNSASLNLREPILLRKIQ